MFLATSSLISRSYERPGTLEKLTLKCPKCISGDCVIVPREWQCAKCFTPLNYGFNYVFYCNCGAGAAFSYSFKCPEPFHGDSFDKFSQEEMSSLLPLKEKMSSSRTTSDGSLNILLLGESGVGKSTFINAFVNYLTFDSLDEALAGELRSPIYSTFITSTEDGEEKEVTVGVPDSEENCEAATLGQSCTQSCRAYKFSAGSKKTVRLIDTPGIGDTRGYDHDMKNVKDIISCISEYDVLHAILILLKPNEERLTVPLRYCISEVLAHLHKDAIDNINFCFTNSRSTMFRPGSTTQLLKHLLWQNPQTAGIKINKDTMYFFDSEAFRYLAARKNGITFSRRDKEDYMVSWSRSKEQSERMILRVASLSPHSLEKMVSLNNVRDFLITIEIKLATMSHAIQDNIESIKKQKEDLEEHYKGTLECVQQLVVCTELPKIIPLGHLRTVCKSCHVEVCHNCTAKETVHLFDDSYLGIFLCKVFRSTFTCRECGCPIGSHRREAMETIKEIVKTIYEDVEKAITERRPKEEIARLSIQKLEEKEKCFREEMEATISAAGLFTAFVVKNSLVAYNSATEEYLEEEIKVKKSLPDTDNSKPDAISRLQISLDKYRNQVDKYRSTRISREGSPTITSKDIHDTLQQLYDLKEHGSMLRQNIETVKRSYEACRNAKRKEVSHVVENSRHAEGGFRSTVSKIWKHLIKGEDLPT